MLFVVLSHDRSIDEQTGLELEIVHQTIKSVWNFDTDRDTSLYLCIEDSITRIQNRLIKNH